MPDGEHRFREFIRETVQEPLRQSRQEREDAYRLIGFTDAAGIALRTFDRRIDELKELLREGSLAPSQQPFLIEPEDLRAKFENESESFWRGTGADWRPVRQVAKRTMRPRQDGGAGPTGSLD